MKFAGTTWLARISPDNDEVFFGKNVDDCSIRKIELYTPPSGQVLADTIVSLSSTGYRPWFAYVKTGEKMDIADAVRFWNNADTPGQADAEAVMAESCAEVFNGSDPAILEGIYISAKYWDDAVKGENPAAPAMRLHVASGKNLSLIWMSDGSPLIEAGRGE